MQILSQLPISMPEDSFSTYYGLLKKAYDLTRDADTHITIQDVPQGITDPSMLNYYGPRELNGQEIVKCMLQAQERGFDAIIGACYFDTGIQTVSNLATIPVIGPAKAAMNIAALIGSRFAVITTEPLWIPEFEYTIAHSEYGQLALPGCPVKAISMPMHQTVKNLLQGNHEPIFEDFYQSAQELINLGAGVIIVGCGLISPLFTIKGTTDYNGVPIIDPMVSALKLAEFMVKLQKINMPITSHQGRFAQPPPGMIKELRKHFLPCH